MAQDFVQLSGGQEFILKALARFRFLTVRQMLMLDCPYSQSQLYSNLKPLKATPKPLVKFIDFGSLPGEGRLDILYFLSDRGADVLLETSTKQGMINYPKRVRAFANDYKHRLACIDFHIAVANWCERHNGTLDFFDAYYNDGKKSGRGTAQQCTTVIHQDLKIVPDGILSFSDSNSISRLCCFERHNGEDAKRIMGQIETYCQALHLRVIEDAYNYPHSARVLIVFEQVKCLQKTQTLFQKRTDLQDYRFNFFLKHSDEITIGNFKSGWHNLFDDKQRNLFS